MCDSPEGRELSAEMPKQESGTGGILMPSKVSGGFSVLGWAAHSQGAPQSFEGVGYYTRVKKRYVGIGING